MQVMPISSAFLEMVPAQKRGLGRPWAGSPNLKSLAACAHIDLEVRKATLASILRKSRSGVRLNEHVEYPEGMVVFQHACALGCEGIV